MELISVLFADASYQTGHNRIKIGVIVAAYASQSQLISGPSKDIYYD